MSVDYQLIGRRIKQARKSNGITQEQLAERLDVSVGYISQMERGITKPNLEMLCGVCGVLNYDLGTLLTGCSTGQSSYLSDELYERCQTLSEQQKRNVLKIIEILLDDSK